MRPKLLFLAYYFPPVNASGAVRTWNLAKYLTRLGWDVTVVTPDPSVWRHVENSQKVDAKIQDEGIQRILTGHRWRCLAPHSLKCWNKNLGALGGGVCRKIARHLGVDGRIGWIKAAERACSALSPKDVDVILVSGHPFAAFSLARRLSDKLRRPYVLDYRDPWTDNPHHNAQPPAVIAEEARLLAACAAVTIVSPSWGMALDQRFELGSKLHVITNGYDPEELMSIKPHIFDHFAIVYTGTFYPPQRVISPVMAALRRLKETSHGQGSAWYFHYYGDKEDHVRGEARRFGLQDHVVLHGRVPRAEALSAVLGADVAVVITSVAGESTLAGKGIITAKVFDALGLQTPMLIVAPLGSDIEIITRATGLGRSFVGSDVEGMVSFLNELMSGQVHEQRDFDFYSWPSIAKQFDGVLRRIARDTIRDMSVLRC